MSNCISSILWRQWFVASHFHDLPGFIERLHGHNWEIIVALKSQDSSLTTHLNNWHQKVHYSYLNHEIPNIQQFNPTAEIICQAIYELMATYGACPNWVEVHESPAFSAILKR